MSGALSVVETIAQQAVITVFNLQYVLSPIVLVGGIAESQSGGVMPIMNLTNSDLVTQTLTAALASAVGLNGTLIPSLTGDQFFAHWYPLPGGEMGKNKVSQYPFSNQAVAGNAMIRQPVSLSMMMVCPTQINYSQSKMIMTTLRDSLNQHDALGGRYSINTPKGVYSDMLRMRMSDASFSVTRQSQNAYQFDFYRPLLTLEEAQATQNALMSKLSAGTPVNPPTWSGTQTTLGSLSTLSPSSFGIGGSAS